MFPPTVEKNYLKVNNPNAYFEIFGHKIIASCVHATKSLIQVAAIGSTDSQENSTLETQTAACQL